MLNINNYLEGIVDFVKRNSPWTNVFGLSRTVLAIGTFLTLALNPTDILFTRILRPDGMASTPFYLKMSLFEIFEENLWLAKAIALCVLILVIIGWRARFTVIFHFWITASFMLSTETPDGGDQISTILSLLFVLFGLGDSRKWHWDKPKEIPNFYSKAFAYSLVIMIRVQVAVIYFHAVVGKLKVNEWINGTAVWYWFKDPIFGMNKWVAKVIEPIIRIDYGVVLITWGSVLIELLLFAGLFMTKKQRKNLLILGLFFHFSIVVVQGLGSFFFAMASALIIYLRPTEEQFTFIKINDAFSKMKNIVFRRGTVTK